jgi:protein arginine kinase
VSLKDIIRKTLSEWMRGTGPENDIVIGSRVRLARNIVGIPFPAVASDDQLKFVANQVEQATKGVAEFLKEKYDFIRLNEVPPLDRQLMVEKHLISPQHTENVKNKAVVLRGDEAVSLMVNEEDHVRIQVLFPGLQLLEAWQLADKVDEVYAKSLNYAFSPKRGFLTSCPTNVGTGMRASIMFHLPALGMMGQTNKVIGTVSQFGLTVRGLYGEGTEALGNIYQMSNQVTLGRSEEEIVHHLANVTQQVLTQERQARQHLLNHRQLKVEDRIWRSYGLLANARLMDSIEAMKLISDVRLGIDLGIVENLENRILQELLVMIRPAHLQKLVGRELDPNERDIHRSELIRERIKLASNENK